MDAYFETARTVIERHGGVVEKFIGDAVMAVWGTPVTHEDDAERAVRAALELVDAVAALGASTGAAAAGPRRRAHRRGGDLPGRREPGHGHRRHGEHGLPAAVRGRARLGVRRARRRSAPPRGPIAFEEVGELTLKGKEEPVRAWRALRVVAERQGHEPDGDRAAVRRSRRGAPPAEGLLHATGREGKSRVVSVTGIGGIGKSRLAWELLKYVDGLAETVWWHHGRCPSYGDGITFWALGEMVRMRAGIAETDAPGVSRSKLAASVAEHVPDEDERHWLEPRLAFLLGLDERPAGGREELFAAWRTFFERISDGGTVAMVFEDLQWADAGSARLHRVDARVVARPSRSSSSRWRAPSSPTAARTGAPASATSWRCTSSRSPTRRWPSSCAGWCRAPTTPPSPGSSSEPRACRCTPWR